MKKQITAAILLTLLLILISSTAFAYGPDTGVWAAYPQVYHTGSSTPVGSTYKQSYIAKDGTIYYAYQIQNNIVFRKYNGSEWTYIGSSGGYTVPGMVNMDSFAAAPDGTPYVSIVTKVNNIVGGALYKFNGTSLVKAADNVFAKEIIFSSSGKPYFRTYTGIGYLDASGQFKTANICTPSDNVGVEDIVLDKNDIPYIVTRSQNTDGIYIFKVYKYVSGSWVKLGNDYNTESVNTSSPHIQVSNAGDIYLSSSILGVNDKFILKLSGSTWIKYLDIPTPNTLFETVDYFKIGSDSNIYILTHINGYTVLKYNGTAWLTGNPLDIGGSPANFSLTSSNKAILELTDTSSTFEGFEFITSLPQIENEKLTLINPYGSPVNTMSLGNSVLINGDILTSGYTKVKALVYNASAQIVASMELDNQTTSALSISWDGKATAGNEASLTVGQYVPASEAGTDYTIKLYAENSAGNIYSDAMPLKITEQKPSILTPIYYNNKLYVGSYSNDIISQLRFSSVLPCTAEASIYNSNNQLVAQIPFTPVTNTSPNYFVISWDKKATSGNGAGLNAGDIVPNNEAGVSYTLKVRINNYAGYVETDPLPLQVMKPIKVSSVTLSSHSRTAVINDKISLTAAVQPSNATFPNVTWSCPTGNAAVDQSGNVTLTNAGTVVITASADGVTDTCNITVSSPTVQTGIVVNCTTAVNVRSGPGTTYSIIGSAPKGATYTVLGQSGSWYKISFNSGTGYILSSYLSVSSTPPPPPTPPATQTGTVVNCTTAVNVRSGPGTTYSILGSAVKGAKYTVTGQSGSWYKIDYNGKVGYISSSYLSVSSTPPPPPSTQKGTVVNCTTAVNVRSGPGTTYSIIGSAPKGATYTVLGQSGSWYKISYNSGTGYISSSYLSVNSI